MKHGFRRNPMASVLSAVPVISSASIRFFRRFCSSGDSVFCLANVTKSNFNTALSHLRSILRTSDFVSFDLEMTGITSAPWRESFEFDDLRVRYLKVKDSAEKFAVLQFGICPFRWDQSSESLIAHPYNFYIFPREDIHAQVIPEFLCQTTSIDFLSKYQFDFNLCVYEGVSYLSRDQENVALKHLSSTHGNEWHVPWDYMNDSNDIPLVRMVDVLFVERLKRRINEWCSMALQCGNDISKFQHDYKKFETIVYKMRPAFVLREFSAHELGLIKLAIKQHFGDLTCICTCESSRPQHIVVHTPSMDDREKLMKEVKDEIHRDAVMHVQESVGFRQVIDLLSSQKKLIVGHNCFLDIAHICHKFLGNLPSTAEEFALLVNKDFPHIIDTKYILNSNSQLQKLMKNGSTSLSKAFSVLCPELNSNSESSGAGAKPRIKVEICKDDKRSEKWGSGPKHEAGYDAFMTGCVFAEACSRLGVDFRHGVELEKLGCHMNRLFISWVKGGIIDLTTGVCTGEAGRKEEEKEKVLTEKGVVLWGFPLDMKVKEIKGCIEQALGASSVSLISHLDETTVFVQFREQQLVSGFLEVVEELRKKTNIVSVLHPLSPLFQGTCPLGCAGYETYREICASPMAEFFFSDQATSVLSNGEHGLQQGS